MRAGTMTWPLFGQLWGQSVKVLRQPDNRAPEVGVTSARSLQTAALQRTPHSDTRSGDAQEDAESTSAVKYVHAAIWIHCVKVSAAMEEKGILTGVGGEGELRKQQEWFKNRNIAGRTSRRDSTGGNNGTIETEGATRQSQDLTSITTWLHLCTKTIHQNPTLTSHNTKWTATPPPTRAAVSAIAKTVRAGLLGPRAARRVAARRGAEQTRTSSKPCVPPPARSHRHVIHPPLATRKVSQRESGAVRAESRSGRVLRRQLLSLPV